MNKHVFLLMKILLTISITGMANVYILFDKQFPHLPWYVWVTNFVVMPVIAYVVIHISTKKLK